MAIVKIIKKGNNENFTTINTTGIKDPNLSFKATGVLAYLTGYQNNSNIIFLEDLKVKTDGVEACRSALKELRRYNYCHMFILQKGKFKKTFYVVYETPVIVTSELIEKIFNELEYFSKDGKKIKLDNSFNLTYVKLRGAL